MGAVLIQVFTSPNSIDAQGLQIFNTEDFIEDSVCYSMERVKSISECHRNMKAAVI